jgi:xylose isomerase
MDLFYGHILGMDTFARGLLAAQKIIDEGIVNDFVAERYQSYKSGFGQAIMNGSASFDSLEKYIMDNGEPERRSGRQEMLESIVATYV